MQPTVTRPDAAPRLLPFDFLLAALLGLFSLTLYRLTLLPGLLPGDSGEFQTLAYLLGIAHTTGYPVYILLARLFTFLPFGEIAFRVNLFSAFMGGVTVAFVFLSARLLSGSRWAAALGALALAVSPIFWSQAIMAEVYTSGSAFVAMLLFCMLLYDNQRAAHPITGGRALFAAGLLGGLSLGVHGTVILMAPAILFLLLVRRASWKYAWRPALIGALLGAALLVVSFLIVDRRAPYNAFSAIYIPAASAWDADPQALQSPLARFWFVFTAQQWRGNMFADPANVMPQNADSFFTALPQNLFWPVILLAGLGLLLLLRRDWRLAVFFMLLILVHLVYVLNYQVGDLYVFFIPGYLYRVCLASVGAAGLLSLVDRLFTHRPVAVGLAGALLLLLALLPFIPSRLAFLQAGQADFPFTNLPSRAELSLWRSTLTSTIRDMEPNAIAFVGWNELYPYYYIAYIEQGRTDLAFVEFTPYSKKPGLSSSSLAYIRSLHGTRPMYFAYPLDELRRAGIQLDERHVGPTLFFQAR